MAKYTREEQQDAIRQVVELINKYHLTIVSEHQIKIVPVNTEETNNG